MRSHLRQRTKLASFAVPLLTAGTWVVAAPCQTGAPTLAVDISSGRHAISPYIYGMANGVDPALAKELALGDVRWGGDAATRYNWQVDSSNSGFDWFFMGGDGVSNPTPSGSADAMIESYGPAAVLMTVPIIPYVNKTSAWNCSFPVSVYGAQQATNPYVHPNGDNCGNSIALNGTQLIDTDIYANHVDNTPALEQGWLQHLVSTFGTAAHGGVPFYQLDNEPFGWGNTHRDVEPNGATYATITQLGQGYAAVIKSVDPTAMVLGPSDFTLGGWIGNPGQQNGLFAGQYYLQQMAAYDGQHGGRTLDYFDEHYYPDVSSPAAQLASTRTFWDPTYNSGTWVEQYFFNGPMQLIPRFKGWIAQFYPGTKLALSEYSIDSGARSIYDALAEMDLLGIYGREQLDFANMWSPPASTDPIAFAFRLYRNYDGNSAQYGDTWVSATSSNQAQLSIYAAQRTADRTVTVAVLNKSAAALNTALQLAGATLPASASVYSYTGANLTGIVHGADVAIANGTIAYTFPPYSATLFTFVPQPVTTTTTLTLSASQITAGQNLTATATVPGAVSPTGTVTFSDGGTTLATVALTGTQASFSTSTLGVGSHSLSARYNGDAGNAASSSATMPVTVVEASTFAGLLVAAPGSFTAPGVAGTMTVTAKDNHGDVMTGFTGTVTLTTTDAAAVISPATYTFTTADAGVKTFALTFNTAGTFTVTATGGAVTGSQTGIVVEDAIWVLNAGDGLLRLTSAGVQSATAGPTTGNSPIGAVAVDNAGDVWATQEDANAIVEYSHTGVAMAVPGSAAAGVNAPTALAVDGLGQVWVANAGNGSVSVLSSGGAAVSGATGYQPGTLNGPTGLAIDSSGSVWVANAQGNTVTKIIGAAAPVIAPTATGTTNVTLGTRP